MSALTSTLPQSHPALISIPICQDCLGSADTVHMMCATWQLQCWQ